MKEPTIIELEAQRKARLVKACVELWKDARGVDWLTLHRRMIASGAAPGEDAVCLTMLAAFELRIRGVRVGARPRGEKWTELLFPAQKA